MPSGQPIVEAQRIAIRRMAALRTSDGRWKWSYDLIAEALGLDRRIVSDEVRRGCAEWVRQCDRGK